MASSPFDFTITEKGEFIMKVSKLKIIAKYFTGGVAGVAEYVLDLFNEMIQKLPKDEVWKYAQLAKDVANFVHNVANALIANEAKKAAALATAEAFDRLATALLDANLTKGELDGVVLSIKAAVAAWKEAR